MPYEFGDFCVCVLTENDKNITSVTFLSFFWKNHLSQRADRPVPPQRPLIFIYNKTEKYVIILDRDQFGSHLHTFFSYCIFPGLYVPWQGIIPLL